ncbi:DUF4270 family protein [Gaoshiqia sp. Z1-71]|uniref:DUF4270 family protein n=1 Tax=Gaoshiqia hydrogeniformans TaxID=3290090 RepID=UPI003BF8512D
MNKNCILAFLLIALFASCNTDVGNFQIGEDLVETKSRIVMIDSFSVKLSTVIRDSIPTSSSTLALVGRYDNEIIGSTEIRHYLNFDLSETSGSLTKDDVFDSITVKLNYDSYYFGDTTQVQQLTMHRLTKQLKLITDPDGFSSLYNTSSFNFEPEPVGSHVFSPRPSNDSIEFRLDDALGLELINYILNDHNEDGANSTELRERLKGFILKTDSESKAVIGYTSSTAGIQLKLYTHVTGHDKVENTYKFSLASDATNFNQVIADRSETNFSGLTYQREQISSVQTGNLTFLQSTAGVTTRIDFPTLNEIFTYGDRVMIRAELVLRPSLKNDMKNLPQTLHFYRTDRINSFGSALTTTSSSGSSVNVSTTLIPDNIYFEDSYYVVDITTFLQNELSGYYYNTNNGLLLTFPTSDLISKANLLFLNGENTGNLRPKLNLYFLKYE